MVYRKETHVQNIEDLRAKRLLAYDALSRAGKSEFKRYETAKWADFYKDSDGRMYAVVQHDDIKGCTPAMLRWFFEHLGCCTTWNGHDFSGPQVSIYHLWHHRNHVAVTPLSDCGTTKNLGFLEGADSRIHELTNEVNDVVYYDMNTVTLNEREFTFNVMKDGVPTGHVKHIYEDNGHNGCTFYCETEVGLMGSNLKSRLINRFLVPKLYSKSQGMQWIAHNIQETGLLQDICPILYANQDKVFFDPDFIKFD